METIQVVLDDELLRTTDRAAKRQKQNRSALIRDALRGHLKPLEIQALEVQDRAGYAAIPQDLAEAEFWESQAAWPQR